MAESCENWKTIERKMKIVIPRYVKNIFTACGYDNFYTIATIDETDLEYFKKEVIEGKVFKYFDGKLTEGDVLADCAYSGKDFEFARGHQKLIMATVKYVKETMDKNGVDGFVSPKKSEKVTKKTKTAKKESSIGPKRLKISTDVVDRSTAVTEEQLLLDINKHEMELSRKATATLEGLLTLLYKKHKEESQNSEIKTEVWLVQNGDDFKFIGLIACPICSKKIKAFNVTLEDGIPTDSWNSSNYDRHCINMHRASEMELKAKQEGKSNDLTANTSENTEKTSNDEDFGEKKDASGSTGKDEGKDTDCDGFEKTGTVGSIVIPKQNEPNEVVPDIVINVEAASNNTLGGLSPISSTKAITLNTEVNTESDCFSKQLKVGDYIQLYVVDLETSQKQTKVAKVTSMTENNVDAYFLEKSTLENVHNCYFTPRNKDEIFLSKSGIVRILRCVSTSSGGELCFSDIVQESVLQKKPKTKLETKPNHKKSGLSKPAAQKKNLLKQREIGWKY